MSTGSWQQQAYQPRHENPALAREGRRGPLITYAALAACEIAGMAALVKSYLVAQSVLTDQAEYLWFWAGMILLVLPIAVLVASERTTAVARAALLILLGLVTYAPKLLRSPIAPDYHDEFAHWRATYNVLATGKLFQPAQIIPIISRYPGLHAATAAIVHASGLSIWYSALVLLILCHLLLLLGIVALARAAGLDSRAAALAGVMYGTNSSFLYFDTEFAYESVAITLLVWSLTTYTLAIRADSGARRALWSVLTALLCAATVVTHHLSSLGLTSIMLLIAVALSVPPLARRDGWVRTAGLAWALALLMVGLTVTWMSLMAPATFTYLSPYLGSGLSQLMQMVGGAGGRKLFAASLSPSWEHYAAYLCIPLSLFLALGGLLLLANRMRRQTGPDGGRRQLLPPGRRRSMAIALTVLGLVYFPSTVFILSAAGAEGARRSWADSWIGLSFLTAPVLVGLIAWAGSQPRRWPRLTVRGALGCALIVAMIGGQSAGLEAAYRFPGPFLYGSDTRSETPELDAMAQWFLGRFGPANEVVTDRYTGLVLASYGLQDTANPSSGFPVYDLYSDPSGKPIGPPFLLYELQSSHYLYLVVDERMAHDIPHVGVYFEPDEPVNFVTADGKPIFAGRLGKFDTTQWLYKVFSSDNYAVYRMALMPVSTAYQKRGVNFRGKLAVNP